MPMQCPCKARHEYTRAQTAGGIAQTWNATINSPISEAEILDSFSDHNESELSLSSSASNLPIHLDSICLCTPTRVLMHTNAPIRNQQLIGISNILKYSRPQYAEPIKVPHLCRHDPDTHEQIHTQSSSRLDCPVYSNTPTKVRRAKLILRTDNSRKEYHPDYYFRVRNLAETAANSYTVSSSLSLLHFPFRSLADL